MVELVPMEQEDFETYRERNIREYAAEHVKNGDWLPEEALEKSRKEVQGLLPDGIKSKNQFIYSIFDDATNQKLGMLWVEVKMDTPRRRAFMYDFIIEEQFRGKGYGKQALAALDQKLISMDSESVGLHVFAHNTVAQELYKKSGYQVTNIIMRKQLKPQ
jgi:ribosomal protein S18 acetylase RimI-like enzyme